MTLKVGSSSYYAVQSGTKIEYWEYVIRTIRTRNGIAYAYWWNKLPGHTWGKVSKKHGDFGWLPNAWRGWCEKRPVSLGRLHAASKLGALADLIADIRRDIREYGPDFDLHEEGATLRQQLKAALTAQKRLRNRRQ